MSAWDNFHEPLENRFQLYFGLVFGRPVSGGATQRWKLEAHGKVSRFHTWPPENLFTRVKCLNSISQSKNSKTDVSIRNLRWMHRLRFFGNSKSCQNTYLRSLDVTLVQTWKGGKNLRKGCVKASTEHRKDYTKLPVPKKGDLVTKVQNHSAAKICRA